MAQKSDRGTEREAGWQVSLVTLLPASMALLVILAVAPVIAVGYFVASETAERLITERAELLVDGLENEMRGLLDPVVAQLGYTRQAVLDGYLDPRDPEDLRTFARGLLAGTPQVFGVGLIGEDLSMRRWERGSYAEIIEPPERLPLVGEAMTAARNGRSAYWAQPFVSIALGDTILNYRVTLEQDGAFLGVLAAGVTSEGLSRYVAEVSRSLRATAFVLAGRDRIITYPDRRAPEEAITSTELPSLASVSDPVIAGIWDDQRSFTQTAEPTRSRGHWSWIGDASYAYFYRELSGYGPDPLIVGVAIPGADTWIERWAARVAAGLGLVLMLLAAAIAWRLGRMLSQPVAAFDGALNSIAELEFDKVALPGQTGSQVREWRAMARRLESAARALSAFQTYLPRALVRRLFDIADNRVESQEREVTVMFMDLEGFTAFARGRSAGEVAAYLNEVFGRVGPIVEASGGVIDKYTGDGLLAFWGAPDAQPDHALRACRAAAEIACLAERQDGPAVPGTPRLRIGLHSGPAIVGNIGFPGRIDYTLVGDTVNVAERTEATLRGIQPEWPVVIAATQEVLDGQGEAAAALIPGEALAAAARPTFICRPAAQAP